jgi:dihydroorotate dehydrogenase electron transfer subunit
MKIELLPVVQREQLTASVVALHIRSAYIASTIQPGQFINIKVQQGIYPLLRRPFSVAYKEDDIFTVIFDVVGEGTRILSEKQTGDSIDVLGPLGEPFALPKNKNTTVAIVAGGLGMAPMPILTQTLLDNGISEIVTFLGARSADYLVDYKLKNVHFATDDNSGGFHGTVVTLFEQWVSENADKSIHVYSCGPNPMLRALQQTLEKHSLHGQVSLECVMACGIGICQGCPVESLNGGRKYRLVCKEGPVFDIDAVVIP